MKNPIIALYRSSDFKINRQDQPAVVVFDHANGEAWNRAGQPEDGPGTQWAQWEDEALSLIESEQAEKHTTAWELLDALLIEWDAFDGDVSYFYDKWASRIDAL